MGEWVGRVVYVPVDEVRGAGGLVEGGSAGLCGEVEEGGAESEFSYLSCCVSILFFVSFWLLLVFLANLIVRRRVWGQKPDMCDIS